MSSLSPMDVATMKPRKAPAAQDPGWGTKSLRWKYLVYEPTKGKQAQERWEYRYRVKRKQVQVRRPVLPTLTRVRWSVALSLDGWTSENGVSILGVIGHVLMKMYNDKLQKRERPASWTPRFRATCSLRPRTAWGRIMTPPPPPDWTEAVYLTNAPGRAE